MTAILHPARPAGAAHEGALGRLEDLPADYVAALRDLNLVPLWPSLRALLPPHRPHARTRPVAWSYRALRPLLMRAGELTPMEKAERRVLVLANPGHGLDNLQASPAMYLGLQLLLPGEWAPAHRHTPNAVRVVVEGEGAYTTVDGERCDMQRGDLILTPTGQWHEHGHDGDQPVVWLDILDVPLIHFLEASYHVDGPRQAVDPTQSHLTYNRGGLLPSVGFARSERPVPMLRYPWSQARAALVDLAAREPARADVQVTYCNPETGGPPQPVLGYYAQMLRPGQGLRLPVRSPALVFHVIEGAVDIDVDGEMLQLDEADTACAPGYSPITLQNRSRTAPAFLFLADEAPLHRKLGVFERRG